MVDMADVSGSESFSSIPRLVKLGELTTAQHRCKIYSLKQNKLLERSAAEMGLTKWYM